MPEKRQWMQPEVIAYFSMEIVMDSAMAAHSGGLGMLADETIRSAADLSVAMVGVTFALRKGYFTQKLDANGWQTEWPVENFFRELPERACVLIEGRTVQLRAGQYTVKGITGFEVAVILLDSDLPHNTEFVRTLTDSLTAEMPATVFSRRQFSKWAVSGCCVRSSTGTFAAST